MKLLQQLKTIGPGAMVAAAFIGPGTVVTATKAGGGFGYSLLWAVALSTIACLILQEMAARLGTVAQLGVGQALRQKLKHPATRAVGIALVLGAILVGNAAYEAGNITGAAMGMSVVAPSLASIKLNPIVIVVSMVAFALLWTGRFKHLEKTLVGLVAVMGITFVVAAIASGPDWAKVIGGLFRFRAPDDAWPMIAGLIGTTVVPYNLFLHASSVREKWIVHPDPSAASSQSALTNARLDAVLSIGLGGLITAAILIAAAGVSSRLQNGSVNSADELAASFNVVAGSFGPYLLCIGFLAAGLSSTITAPLAAAFATTEVLGWRDELDQPRFRIVWASILILGTVFASLGFRPDKLIVFAQVANGLLLPIVAVFLLLIMNDRKIMSNHANRVVSNLLGGLVVLFTIYIGIRGVWRSGIIQMLIGQTGP